MHKNNRNLASTLKLRNRCLEVIVANKKAFCLLAAQTETNPMENLRKSNKYIYFSKYFSSKNCSTYIKAIAIIFTAKTSEVHYVLFSPKQPSHLNTFTPFTNKLHHLQLYKCEAHWPQSYQSTRVAAETTSDHHVSCWRCW
jgi:hypothetical protein